jgi:hypothetical protein
MLRYNLLFVHIISAMGVFTSLGMEALVLIQLRRAQDSASARAALAAFSAIQRVSGLSMLVLLLTGLYLATAYWQWRGAWMGSGILGLVAVGAVGGVMTGRRVARLRTSLGAGETGASLGESLPALRASLGIRAALLVGVVYLMTVKPGGVTG